VAGWNELWNRCPWATSFQSPAFVRLWYHSYRDAFEAVLIEREDEAGRLTGLLPLAIPRGARRLIGAGAEQAEYQGWLSPTADGDAFFLECLAILRRQFRNYSLHFPFLAPGTPTGWCAPGSRWHGATEIRHEVRGIMPLGDGTSFDQSLRKKSNRSRFNRLERLGPIALTQLTSAAELEAIMDETAALYDLRQGALNGITPFQDDPRKRQFHVDLLAEAGLLHATVLRVGDTIASVHLDMHNRDEVLLCVIAHSPILARHSPGKFHILLLGKQLAGQGVRAFDMSPGGEYKDRFATTHEAVVSVRIALGVIPHASARARQLARRIIVASGFDAGKARTLLGELRRLGSPRGAASAVKQLGRALAGSRVIRGISVYRLARLVEAASPTTDVGRDRITEVMGCLTRSRPDRASLHRALWLALLRLESGDQAFTRSGPGMAIGWLAHRDDPLTLEEFDLEFTAPPGTTVLYDISGRGTEGSSDTRISLVRAMVATARDLAPGAPVLAVIPQSDHSLGAVLESVGFVPDPALLSGLRRTPPPEKRPPPPSDTGAGGQEGEPAEKP
jgi:CelD/BcsL family acetyltransferase involved in cellulose biosynthesis